MKSYTKFLYQKQQKLFTNNKKVQFDSKNNVKKVDFQFMGQVKDVITILITSIFIALKIFNVHVSKRINFRFFFI